MRTASGPLALPRAIKSDNTVPQLANQSIHNAVVHSGRYSSIIVREVALHFYWSFPPTEFKFVINILNIAHTQNNHQPPESRENLHHVKKVALINFVQNIIQRLKKVLKCL